MILRSIIWIPLALILSGCGDSSSKRAARETQLLAEAKNLIVEGVSKINWEDAGDYIAVDYNCVPEVLEKCEQAAAVLRPAEASNTSVMLKLIGLDNAIAKFRQSKDLADNGTKDKSKMAESFFMGVGFLVNAFELPSPFNDKSSHRAKHIATTRQGNGSRSEEAEINGLFGLNLGQQLPARIVRKVDGWREMAEVGAYCVTPPEPWEALDTYTLELFADHIHKISASSNGRGQALTNNFERVKQKLTARFGPPTSTGTLDARGDSGVAWQRNLPTGGQVRMTLALRNDSTFASGAIIPGHVFVEIQRAR